jgi:hypothetical protein
MGCLKAVKQRYYQTSTGTARRFGVARHVVLALLVAWGITSCKRQPDVSLDQFIPAYCELRLATEIYGKTEAQARMQRAAILQKHGYTPEQFIQGVQQVKMNANIWQAVQDSIDSYLEAKRLQNQAAQSKQANSATADSAQAVSDSQTK